MKRMIYFICALFFVLTGFNQQERFVEQSNTGILGSVSAVGQKPEIIQRLMRLEVNEGGIAVFLAQFTPINDSGLKIEWYRNDKPVPIGDRIKAYRDVGDATLVINKVELGDAGTYTIRIYNTSGEVKSSARLIVTE